MEKVDVSPRIDSTEDKTIQNVSELNLEKLLDLLKLDPQHVLNVYQFGSRVYGTATPDSDWDFVIVMDNTYPNGDFLNTANVDACTFNEATFNTLVQEHYIFVLMCLFLPKQFVWKEEKKSQFDLSIGKLRSNVSKEGNRTWVKAKKKFTLEDNKPLGKKNIVNAIREVLFGIQIATEGKITDFTVANKYKEEILKETSDDWIFYEKKYKPIYKEYIRKFKVVAPKTADKVTNSLKDFTNPFT